MSAKDVRDTDEQIWMRIWEKQCNGRCAVLHLERCPRYESGECKFPEMSGGSNDAD